MKVGVFSMPTQELLQPAECARLLEERGYESLWLGEHSHIPAAQARYVGGDALAPDYWMCHDPFVYLAQVAAASSQLKVATGICAVTEHHPIGLAKRVASLDVLSQGRFLFGVGTGWHPQEIENHGVAFGQRWQYLREAVLAMKEIWTREEARFTGEHVRFEPLLAGPSPLQKPHPPIHVGAYSKAAIRRVAEFADGWMPPVRSARDSAPPHLGLADFEGALGDLRRLLAERGRAAGSVEISAWMNVPQDALWLEELRRLGVARIVLVFPFGTKDSVCKLLDEYATLVERAAALR